MNILSEWPTRKAAKREMERLRKTGRYGRMKVMIAPQYSRDGRTNRLPCAVAVETNACLEAAHAEISEATKRAHEQLRAKAKA